MQDGARGTRAVGRLAYGNARAATAAAPSHPTLREMLGRVALLALWLVAEGLVALERMRALRPPDARRWV